MKDSFIPLMVPDIRDEDIQEVVEVLKSGMLVQGKYVNLLEDRFAGFVGTKYAVAVSNGTASLHIALKAHGIGAGDEVIVPAFSYIATANVVELVGATPIFVDIEASTFNLDVNKIEEKITSKTKAIIPVHEFGLPCDIDSVIGLAKKYNLIVIEDAACGLGSKLNDLHVGSFAQAGSFSFHPRKAITGGEGGMLVTNDEELAEKFRILRNHGISTRTSTMDFVDAGFNYRMTDIQAALIYSQFQRLSTSLQYKEQLAHLYSEKLANHPLIQIPFVPESATHSWQSYHLLLEEGVDRDKLIDDLKNAGVGSNLGAQCIPHQTYYQQKYHYNCKEEFPNALKSFERGLVLPLYERLESNNIGYISDTLKRILS